MKIKNDRYKKQRGGNSRFYQIVCAKCKHILLNYQKDGPGGLIRLYHDRINNFDIDPNSHLICPKCQEIIGLHTIYKSERIAYRLIHGKINKKLLK